MKKIILSAGLILTVLSGSVYAQTTTLSTNPNETDASNQKGNATGTRKTTDGTHNPKAASGNAATQAGKATNAGSKSNADGNVDAKVSKGGNAAATSPASSVGADSKSTANPDSKADKGGNAAGNSPGTPKSEKTTATATTKTTKPAAKAATPIKVTREETLGAINKTEPDTKVKAGSGSSEKNMKNKTGKTGNYQNGDTNRKKVKK